MYMVYKIIILINEWKNYVLIIRVFELEFFFIIDVILISWGCYNYGIKLNVSIVVWLV